MTKRKIANGNGHAKYDRMRRIEIKASFPLQVSRYQEKTDTTGVFEYRGQRIWRHATGKKKPKYVYRTHTYISRTNYRTMAGVKKRIDRFLKR